MQKTFHIYEYFYLGFVPLCLCGGGICFCSFTGVLRSPRVSVLPNFKGLTALLITCPLQWPAMCCFCSVWPLNFYCWTRHWLLGLAEDATCQVYSLPNLLGSAFSPKLQTSDAQLNLLSKQKCSVSKKKGPEKPLQTGLNVSKSLWDKHLMT